MIPAIWNYLVGYGVGTAIAVIGLYIAFVIPVYLRYRLHDQFVPGAWSLGKHYKWIDLLSIGWVALITILFVFPLYAAGLPWRGRLHLGADELHGAVVRRRSASSSAAGGSVGEELVQGPRPAGHRGGARADERPSSQGPQSGAAPSDLSCCGSDEGRRQRRPSSSHITGAGTGGAVRADLIRRTAAAATSASTPAARKAAVYSPVCVRISPAPHAAVAAPS